MTEQELVDGFESGTLPADTFHHRDHVRLTWIYLERHGREEAERRLLAGLRAFATRAGKPEKFDASLTQAWVAVIDAARRDESVSTFEQLVSVRPDLLTRAAVQPNG